MMPPNSVDLNRMSTGNALSPDSWGWGVFLSSEMPHSISVNWQFPLVWMLYFCAMAGMYDLIPHFSSFQRRLASAPKTLAFQFALVSPGYGVLEHVGWSFCPSAFLSQLQCLMKSSGGWKPGAPSTVSCMAWKDEGQWASSQTSQVGSPLWPEVSSVKDPAFCLALRRGAGVSGDQQGRQAAKSSPKATQPANKRYFLGEWLHSKPTEMS